MKKQQINTLIQYITCGKGALKVKRLVSIVDLKTKYLRTKQYNTKNIEETSVT